MKGILYVDLPEACVSCDFFKPIMNEPLLIKFAGGRVEEVKGACMCALDIKHRLKPMDNGRVLEQISEHYSTLGKVSTTGIVHTGRPEWCQIKAEE